jgi:DNA-binding XRE family transcriptional regulator
MKLSDWMTAQGLDDEQLGNLVQADRVTISRIRRGLNRPSWELAGRIKKASSGAVGADDFLSPLKATAS